MAAKEKKRLEEMALAMSKARDDAERRFVQHNKERSLAEKQDRARRDVEQFNLAMESERILVEQQKYKVIAARLQKDLQLALEDHKRHKDWSTISSCQWLPDVENSRSIMAFLSEWKDEQEEALGAIQTETVGYVSCTGQGHEMLVHREKTRLLQDNLTVTRDKKHSYVDHDLKMCCTAATLTQMMYLKLDEAIVNKDQSKINMHTHHLVAMFEHILETIDRVTATILQHLDFFLEPSEEQVAIQRNSQFVKLGVWAKVGGSNVPRLIEWLGLGIALEGKEQAKLSKQLTLVRYPIAIRVAQFGFDPMSIRIPLTEGQEYIALNCVLIVDHMEAPDQPALYAKGKKRSDWTVRHETVLARKIKKLPFPPPVAKDQVPDKIEPVKVRYDVPDTVVVRHRAPMVGAWNWETMRWDPYGTDLQNLYDRESRRASFLTEKLGILGIIQEKGFDVPYENWSLQPLGYNQVMYTIECRRRGEVSDREIKILVQDNMCKVIQPEEKELTLLRTQWHSPATLFRLLATSGYNLILTDADAEFTPNVLPKAAVLETRVYTDMANFCSTLAFASTHHNKFGEDRNMCLFRISKDWRPASSDEGLLKDTEEMDLWHTIRFEKERCVITKAQEGQKDPVLGNAEGKEAHLNMYMLMSAEIGENVVATELDQANVLLRHAVFQMLSLTRPLTWG